MFYEAKVTEAIALVVDGWKAQSKRQGRTPSAADLAGLQNVVSYIADHYAFDLPLKRLASIACMSESKRKTTSNSTSAVPSPSTSRPAA